MNDDFIYKALPKIPMDFAESLYARISTNPVKVSQRGVHPKRITRRWIQIAMIILGLLLLVAWSQIRLLVRYVPIGDLWLVESARTTQNAPGDGFVTPVIPTPGQLPTVISDGIVVELLKINKLSPDWTPEGFSALEVPEDWIAYEKNIGMWSNDAQEKIQLFAVPISGGMHPYAPAGMYEEVRVNGEPAILIHGRLALTDPKNPTARRKWDESLGFQLSWTIEEAVYTLETFGPYLSKSDLIRMAESMKVVPWSQVP